MIKWKDKEYPVRPFDNKMKQAYLICELAKLKAVNDINLGYDLTKVNEYEASVIDMQNRIELFNKGINEEGEERKAELTSARDSLQVILDEKVNEFNSDVYLQNLKKAYNTEISQAIAIWMGDIKVTKPFMLSVLAKTEGIDWNDFDIDGLFSQCVSFFISGLNRNKTELVN